MGPADPSKWLDFLDVIQTWLPVALRILPILFQLIGLIALIFYSVNLFQTHYLRPNAKGILKSMIIFSLGMAMDFIIS
ncbi:MAG: hypothetical protein ACXAE3_02985 [Candidatus Kariarchaeaceae archaeon]